MPVFRLPEKLSFPSPFLASDGLLAVGGDLSAERLLLAYKSGIFPWYNEDEPILWHSPNPRAILFFDDLKIQKSMRPYLSGSRFTITCNANFNEVIKHCKSTKRSPGNGTWITEDIINAYEQLHAMGYAHSIEVWQQNELVGGLYGVGFGKYFCGESMFSLASNASKFALIKLSLYLKEHGFTFIDCQIQNDHLKSLGCSEVDLTQFLKMLKSSTETQLATDFWNNITF